MARRLSTILKDAFTADKITEDLWFEFFNVCGNAWVEFLTHPAQPGQTVGPPVALNVDGHEDPTAIAFSSKAALGAAQDHLTRYETARVRGRDAFELAAAMGSALLFDLASHPLQLPPPMVAMQSQRYIDQYGALLS